jgi:co-chaperonin GroES (HSP10)
MSLVAAKNTKTISEAKDPKQAIIELVGDLSHVEIFHNQILVATYVRPSMTKGGILRPDINVKEDEYQGKVGLVLKKGPAAFISGDDGDFMGQNVEIGDWVVYRIGDGWPLTVRDTACRILTDRTIRMRIQDPSDIY